MRNSLHSLWVCIGAHLLGGGFAPAQAQSAHVIDWNEIANRNGGFTGALDRADGFGMSVETLGDLSGDGTIEIALGAPGDDDGPFPTLNSGALWILSIGTDTNVQAHRKLSATSGGLGGILNGSDNFGTDVANLGDVDIDGTIDLAVGAPNDNVAAGATWIVFLSTNGTVKGTQKIGVMAGGFGGNLDSFDEFGSSVCALGDMDGDGFPDVAVGAPGDDDGGCDFGAVWLLSLNSGGKVKRFQKISATQGGFTGILGTNEGFGSALDGGTDIDGDGIVDLVVGAPFDTDNSVQTGSVWVLFLNADGTVKGHQKISATVGGFGGTLASGDGFGSAVEILFDRNSDGQVDLAVGAADDDGGALWVLSLASDGTVIGESKVDRGTPNFGGEFATGDQFGIGIAELDIDGDGLTELLVGADLHDSSIFNRCTGAVWVLDVCADADPLPAFSASSTIGAPPFSVAFANETTGTGPFTWQWSFGDGGTSTEEHPNHVYTDIGTYSVNLHAQALDGACATYVEDFAMVVAGASATNRNGSGVNPDVFASLGAPFLGSTWMSQLDGNSIGASGLTLVFGWEGSLPGTPTLFGELLVDPSTPLVASSLAFLFGGVSQHSVRVPRDTALAGFTFSVQGFFNSPGQLTNAIDLVLGL